MIMENKMTLDEVIGLIKSKIENKEKLIGIIKNTDCYEDPNATVHHGEELLKKEISEYSQLIKWLEDAGKYQAAKENGLIVEWPCDIGDTVYVITTGVVCEATVTSMEGERLTPHSEVRVKITARLNIHGEKGDGATDYFVSDYVGGYIYLTEEAANKKLEEMKEAGEL